MAKCKSNCYRQTFAYREDCNVAQCNIGCSTKVCRNRCKRDYPPCKTRACKNDRCKNKCFRKHQGDTRTRCYDLCNGRHPHWGPWAPNHRGSLLPSDGLFSSFIFSSLNILPDILLNFVYPTLWSLIFSPYLLSFDFYASYKLPKLILEKN